MIITNLYRREIENFLVKISRPKKASICDAVNLFPYTGAINYIGQGTGSLLAGFINDKYGWKYYFYYSGGWYIVGLLLHVIFVHELPNQYW